VVDTSDQAVTEFWIAAIPPEGASAGDGAAWLKRGKDFPGGVAELAFPQQPFRVEVHLRGGARAAVVGPFDPEELPERIDVVVPDR